MGPIESLGQDVIHFLLNIWYAKWEFRGRSTGGLHLLAKKK